MEILKPILILDDDEAQLVHLSNLLKNYFDVTTVNNPIHAHKLCSERQFDAIIVDVHMPIINGFEFIKTIKSTLKYETALFILSSDNTSLTKLLALELGVKDFLWPDMLKDELVLRIRNHIKTTPNENSNNIRTYKYLQIDHQISQAFLHGKKIELTIIEFKILSCLVNSAGKTISRNEIKNTTWPGMSVLDNTLNTHLFEIKSTLSNSNIDIQFSEDDGVILL